MTEMQKQFEEWLNGEFDTVQVNGLQVYASFVVQRMWDAWQASRAALVVKLPDWDCYDTPRQVLEACEDSLIHAGVEHSYD